jgi:predicted acetyltransferase
VTNDEYTLRAGTPDDWDAVDELLADAFHEDPGDDETRTLQRSVFEPERAALMFHGGTLVGASASYSRDLTVPGGVLPSAHVTMVGVEATHRRRGVLTRMMSRLFDDARRLGEPVAHLWASEGRIYQRYGYGLAAPRLTLDADHEVQLREAPAGEPRLRVAPAAQVADEVRALYERTLPDRPGWSSRDDRWWHRMLADPKSWRNGATPLRALVHGAEGGGIDGYALFRVRNDEFSDDPATVLVREIVAADPVAYRALWHFLLNLDLTRRTRFGFAATDEPLIYLVNEPRQLNARLADALWVRLVDVPAALAGRRYPVPVDVVLRTEDPLLPDNSGAWHLTGGPDGATCTRTDRPADLDCELGALGAAYLGGTPLGSLAAAGRIRELVPGTLAPADAAFRWHRAPSATEVF